MQSLRTKVRIKNKYDLVLYDADGNVKESATAYNLVTNWFWNNVVFSNAASPPSYYWFRYLGIGTGTGVPNVGDTTFFKYLSTQDTEQVSFDAAYPTSTYVCRATFPASTSVVGEITEVGFVTASGSSTVLTHAMLQDSEGNTITITKTDTDVLVVTATVYLTVTAFEPLRLVQPGSLGFLNMLRTSGIGRSSFGDTHLSTCKPFPENGYVVDNGGGASNSRADATTRSITRGSFRVGPTVGNGRAGLYVNAVHVESLGTVDLPNADFFPQYRLQPMRVGIGDGSTTSFKCPIPDFIANTEEVRVDGALLTRGTDYTVDPVGNTALNVTSKMAHSNFAESVTGGLESYSSYCPCVHLVGQISRAMSTISRPLLFDMGKAVECNALFIDGLAFGGSSTTATYNTTVVLEYSSDASTWTEATRVTSTSRSYSYLDRFTESEINKLTTFSPVSARYWRMYVLEDQRGYGFGSAYGHSFFGKVGEGIKFTNPPADGSVITISAEVDRPFKTADYLLDYSVSVYY